MSPPSFEKNNLVIGKKRSNTPVPYLQPYRHHKRAPRCVCTDCTEDYASHDNLMYGYTKRADSCNCIECTSIREIDMPAPPTTPVTKYLHFNEASQQEQDERQRKSMASINMCERSGCNAFIRGNAVGLVQVRPNGDYRGDVANDVKNWEICPACVAEVDTLLNTAPTSARERAYDKPYMGYKPQKAEGDAVEEATAEQLAAALFEKLMREASKNRAITAAENEDTR